MNTRDRYDVPPALEAAVAEVRRRLIDLSRGDMDRGRKIARDVKAAVAQLSGAAGFPVLLNGEAFTAGSFGRRTQAQPLDDIDLFIPLDAAALRLEDPNGNLTQERLVSREAADALGCRDDLNEGRWNDSGKTLDLIVAGLPRIALAATDIGKNARGRCAHLTYTGINVDLVFVLWSARAGSIDRYHLPSGAGATWRTANPKDDQQRLSEANQHQHSGLLLPTIRALKAWNDHACAGRLKSIHLEVLATEVLFADVEIASVLSALTFALHRLPDVLAGPCPDPTGLGPDLDSSLHAEDREWVRQAAHGAASAATAAIAQASRGDIDGAASAWQSLLLDDGPPAPDRGRGAPEPGRHDTEFGQPAHQCAASGAAVPPARAEERPARPSDQRVRREYA